MIYTYIYILSSPETSIPAIQETLNEFSSQGIKSVLGSLCLYPRVKSGYTHIFYTSYDTVTGYVDTVLHWKKITKFNLDSIIYLGTSLQ